MGSGGSTRDSAGRCAVPTRPGVSGVVVRSGARCSRHSDETDGAGIADVVGVGANVVGVGVASLVECEFPRSVVPSCYVV